MAIWALRLLTLLGLLFVEPGFGQRGDTEGSERLKAELIKNLEDKLRYVEKRQSDADALEARLNATVDELTRQKAEVDRLSKENQGLQKRLNATEEEINKLKQSSAKVAHQIAFSASLADSGETYRGPCTEKTLVFKRVFSNTGGYDQNTGIFTAPVNGLYYFSFSTYGYNSHVMGAALMKNGIRQISTYDSPSADGSDSSSNAAVLQLAAGDEVYMELWDDGRVFDNLNGHTTFSGFLVFPA
ncbi:complement C1q tumor necrosis factor-related protein 3-like [Chelmon rostratus]|uniref:complement C1q tumor necrosis factor-related protein 3-like n=1 Tax=Chelmon rostratus TaxID=109905 RepID=UPI001BE8F4E7|nr:complement C1q tumor necrosis factor-related protein 3-like [Chelmon rostratus]